MTKPALSIRDRKRAALNGIVVHDETAIVARNGKAKQLERQNGHRIVPCVVPAAESRVGEVVNYGNGQGAIECPAIDVFSKSNRSSALVQRDGKLIDRCLAGDVSAWSEIYREFHDSLLVSIRRYLNRAGQDANLVDEIAARVWYALVKNGFELLAKFDVARGCRLSTYLSVLAKNETRVLFRSERRRKSREHLASRPDISDVNQFDTHQVMSDSEFLMTLSQAERAYFLEVLAAQPTDREVAEQSYSTENSWQLRHRIRKKLEQFISESDA